ncbi:hypothetical protein, partial [Carnobacterium maltaromaticum]|uniref:hypothetical protein n=1 Tax=Carnobacterium maltaromaticum TaxID=2751 RepID=UPI002ADE5E38
MFQVILGSVHVVAEGIQPVLENDRYEEDIIEQWTQEELVENLDSSEDETSTEYNEISEMNESELEAEQEKQQVSETGTSNKEIRN